MGETTDTALTGGWTLRKRAGDWYPQMYDFYDAQGNQRSSVGGDEADILQQMAAALVAERQKAQALADALRAVEWPVVTQEWDVSTGRVTNWHKCWICDARMGRPHTASCIVGRALAAADGEGGQE